MVKARFLSFLFICLLLFPLGVSVKAEKPFSDKPVQAAVAKWRQRANAVDRIHKTLPEYRHHNLKFSEGEAVFFAFNPKDEKIPFGWYKLNAKDPLAQPRRVISSSDFSSLFRAGFSSDNAHVVTTEENGEIVITDLGTGNRESFGRFTTEIGGKALATYSNPTYTPDGKILLFHNPWENTLLAVDAATKAIKAGLTIPGFWLEPMGGVELPSSGSDIAAYQFSYDGKRVKFGDHTLNLETFTRQ